MYIDFTKLRVWQKAHEVALDVYKLTANFPRQEQFCLTQQLRRAAISVPSNIVEGKARGFIKEYIRFLLIARGSLEEITYQILLAKDLGYLEEDVYHEFIGKTKELGKLLGGLIKNLRQQK